MCFHVIFYLIFKALIINDIFYINKIFIMLISVMMLSLFDSTRSMMFFSVKEQSYCFFLFSLRYTPFSFLFSPPSAKPLHISECCATLRWTPTLQPPPELRIPSGWFSAEAERTAYSTSCAFSFANRTSCSRTGVMALRLKDWLVRLYMMHLEFCAQYYLDVIYSYILLSNYIHQ